MKRPTWTKTRMRRVAALWCAALLSLAALTGCGGGSGDSNTAGASSAQKSDPKTSSTNRHLPDGFPKDVPLPGYEFATKLPTVPGPLDTWAVLFQLNTTTETPVEDYGAQLEDAGYTVKDGPLGSMTASGPNWEIKIRSHAKGTLSIRVIDQ